MKSPSRYLNAYLRTTPSRGYIKKWAHAATVAFAALIVPSLCAIYFRQAGLKEAEPYWVWAAVTIWKIHGVVAVVALLLWVIEKPRLTRYEPVGYSETEASDPPRPRSRLRLLGLAALAGVFGWMTYDAAVFAIDSWRWRQNVFLEAKLIVRMLMFALLTAGAAFVPVVFLVTRVRAFVAKMRTPGQATRPTLPKRRD